MVKGTVDPYYSGCVQVPYRSAPKHPVFVRLNPNYNFKSTYYRYDKKAGSTRCLVTVCPDGIHLAWDTCGRCYAYYTKCKCAAGVQAPRSVEYIYDSRMAKHHGEEWSINHKDYKGSLNNAMLAARADDGPRRYVMPSRDLVGTAPTSKRPAPEKRPPRLLRKADAVPVAAPAPPPRKLLKKSTIAAAASAVEAVDISAMDSVAEELMNALSDQFKKTSPPRKLLKKVTVTPKKLIKRK